MKYEKLLFSDIFGITGNINWNRKITYKTTVHLTLYQCAQYTIYMEIDDIDKNVIKLEEINLNY